MVCRPTIGHYTQLMWAETNKVGCGISKYHQDNLKKILLVCNYYPTGNRIGHLIYESGEPCTSCPGDRCNEKYNGLCGKNISLHINHSYCLTCHSIL